MKSILKISGSLLAKKLLFTVATLYLILGFKITVLAQNKQPRLFILNKNLLQTNKGKVLRKDTTLTSAYQDLMREAQQALKQKPMSVMEKKNNPPSGDKHDFMSLAPYFWPDSTKPNGLPYIRKDGQKLIPK